ncbi:MAG: hypothetical protein EBU01_11025 [Crocinitomicaceae bacterium]|nr:hypothetical protein [Crocinitomicaceae bacterium]
MKLQFALILLLFISSCQGQTKSKDYNALLQEIEVKKSEFQESYSNANATKKVQILEEARVYLTNVITNDIFNQWYGTKWDFNGTTRTPQKGEIACGYFVTTVLVDVGFKIPRIKWAQSASEVFIKKLAPNNLKRFTDRPLSEVKKYLFAAGNGLYLVGLDNHVGFVLVDGKSISFIHSNYYFPEVGVMKEDISTKNPLKDSHYRIFGKLLMDEMVVNWLEDKEYE